MKIQYVGAMPVIWKTTAHIVIARATRKSTEVPMSSSAVLKNTMDDQIYDLSSGNSRVVNKNKLINNSQKRGKYSKVENASYILFIHMTKQFYILWKSLIHLSCKKWPIYFCIYVFVYLPEKHYLKWAVFIFT